MKKLLLLFSVLCAFVLFLAFLMGLMFVVALVVGGEWAGILSSYTLIIKSVSMYTATFSVLIGLTYIYLSNNHGLMFGAKK